MSSRGGARFWGFALTFSLMGMGLLFMAFVIDLARNVDNPVPVLGLGAAVLAYWGLFRSPVGKAIAHLLEGGPAGDDQMLGSRVADLEDRLHEIGLETQRFGDIEERLDFTERMMAQHNDRQVGKGDG